MRAIRVRPHTIPKIVDIDNTLEALQKEVGGYIEVYPLNDDVVIVCDEEGRLKGEPVSLCLYNNGSYVDFVGTVLILGVDGEDFTDVPTIFEHKFDFISCVNIDRTKFRRGRTVRLSTAKEEEADGKRINQD